MTQFNPENKKVLTYGEVLSPVACITDEKDAAQYLESYIAYIINSQDGLSKEKAREIALQNIGYFAGYCDMETADRILKIFHTLHPVFGSAFPTPEEALEMGKRLASKVNNEDLI